jgi:hypothetical protein
MLVWYPVSARTWEYAISSGHLAEIHARTDRSQVLSGASMLIHGLGGTA